MKLAHRDFRPPRRSKYVNQPPKRRPTLRILFLAILGMAIYLKFDSIAASPALQRFKDPGRLLTGLFHPKAASAVTSPLAQSWSPDSQAVTLECPASPEACLGAEGLLRASVAGPLRELIGKGEIRSGLDTAIGFRAEMTNPVSGAGIPDESGWQVQRLELSGTRQNLVFIPVAGKASRTLCAPGLCLDDLPAQRPLETIRRVTRESDSGTAQDFGEPIPSVAVLEGGKPGPVRSILRGRVVSLPTAEHADQWIKLHHGGNLFSYYRGCARLDTLVRVGAMVNVGDTLGWLADDSAGLRLRIEKDGLSLDPIAFLGLPGEGELAHAR